MEIGPPLPPAFTTASSPSRLETRKRSEASANADAQARDALELAQERSDELSAEAEAIERDGGDTLNRMRQDTDAQEEQERTQEQDALESVKAQGYENLRKTQQAQAAELSRVRRDGEAELAHLKEFYRNSTYQAASRGAEELRNTERRQAERKDDEELLANQRLEQLHKERESRLQNARSEGDRRIEQAIEAHREAYRKLDASSESQAERERRLFEDRFKRLKEEHQQALQRVRNESAGTLGALRGEMSRKLAAYRERQADPFYKLVDLDARFFDEPDRYVLRARVPEQERGHIKISAEGDRIVLAGFRRSEEKLDVSPGHSRATSSYQSFSESFPVDWPVDPQRITREYDGDWMIVTLPKKERPGPPVFRGTSA